jgi:glycyl-tRNA synthetase
MPSNSNTELKTIVDFARRKGFVFQSSEIYGGFAATYDFGPLGKLLKDNLVNSWRDFMINHRTDTVEIEGAIFLHPKVWEASGHIGGFSDLLVEDLITHKRYRADHLVEEAKVSKPYFLNFSDKVSDFIPDENFCIEGERVILKVISLDYLDDIFANFTNEITTYMFPQSSGKIEDTQKFIEEARQKTLTSDDLQLVILDKKTNEFIGFCGLHSPSSKSPEFGIWIAKNKHGNGYGREAIANLKNWADENLQAECYIYPVDKNNVPSQKIPESLGGNMIHNYKKKNQTGEKVLDLQVYRIPKGAETTLSESEIDKIEKELTDQGYNLLIDCLITNDKGQVFAQKRSNERRLFPNCWDFPGGHVEDGDSVYKTIIKEVKEELNLEVDKVLSLFDKVEWIKKESELKPGQNPKNMILQFVITVKNFDNLKLEEGKAIEYKWIDDSNIEILKDNGGNNEYYTYNTVRKFLESEKNDILENKTLTDAGSLTSEEIDQIIEYYNLKSPEGNPLSKARKFNLLVKTHLGPLEDDSSLAYLKGEACANTYVDWKAVQETTRRKLPFGIGQMGKAFRNEITVKQYMFRTREFEQIDMEFFVKPPEFVNKDKGEMDHYQWFAYWKDQRYNFYTEFLGYNPENLKWHQHSPEELVFYAAEAWDIYYHYGKMGYKEMEGIHNRTDYDTRQHQKFSGSDLTYLDPETNQRYLPYIVEMSLGVNRLFLSTLFEFYTEDKIVEKGKEETRIVLKLPLKLAPYKFAILPLMKKDGLKENAEEIFVNLRKAGISCDFDETGSIGKRYRRQDENGTPFCVCVDYQTLEDDTVTVRNRDTMEQERVKIEELNNFLK